MAAKSEVFFKHQSDTKKTMQQSRRNFMSGTTAVLASGVLSKSGMAFGAGARGSIRAVAFDAFPIFDPRPVFALAEQLFPGNGAGLSNAWRIRQFEYQWLRALAGHYADFWRTTEDSLIFAAKQLNLDLTAEKRDDLMAGYLRLTAWPDAKPTLLKLKNAGIRIAFLSNATRQILDAGIGNSGLEGLFDHVLSTDQVRSFKPDPRAYQLGVDALGLRRSEIAFVAFAGWDVAGAKWFGYPTFWANRLNVPAEVLGGEADATGRDLSNLPSFVHRS